LTDKSGIPLTSGWVTAALLQFRDKPAVWADHRFPAYASVCVAWEDFSAAVNEVFIPIDAVAKLERDWESLLINGGEHGSTFNEYFEVLGHQLEPHAPLSDERLHYY